MAVLHNNILSNPAEVRWMGFRSNTLSLQEAGWRIAVEEQIHNHKLRLLLATPDLHMYGLSDFYEHDYFNNRTIQFNRYPLVFHINHFAPKIEVLRIDESTFNFVEIDAIPRQITTEYNSIEDFKIFAPKQVEPEDIIVEPMEVSQLLEQIKRMQSPEQQEIRARNRTREYMKEKMPVVHANIITLGDYRKAA